MIELHYPDRAAPALLGGVLYQALWSAVRALSLSPDEVLVLEGDEDVVTAVIDNGVVVELTHEQIKNLETTLTARKAPVYETVFAFLCSFHQLTLENRRCTFVFTSNAALGRQVIDDVDDGELRYDERLEVDLLAGWSSWTDAADADVAKGLVAAVSSLVERYVDTACRERAPGVRGRASSITAKRVRDALAFLEAVPGRWARFLSAVSWNVNQEGAQPMFGRLVQLLGADPRVHGLPIEPLAYRLVMEMLSVGARPDSDDRRFTAEDVATLAETTRDELEAWAARANPLRLWQLELDARVRRTEEHLARLETAIRRGDAPEVSAAVVERYVAWSKAETRTFRVFGEDTPFDIEYAWPLEAEIKGRTEPFDAVLLLEAEPTRLVLLGEGGAGKSTLLRAVAHRAAAEDIVVLRVRLRELRPYMAEGAPFALALARCLGDRAALTEPEARAIVAVSEILLADGLDECTESADGMAQEIQSYSDARPDLRVVVATRVSHAQLLTPSFAQVHLLPLALHVQRGAVERLLLAAGAQQEAIDSAIIRVASVLGEAKLIATPLNLVLALDLARNPRAGRVTRASLFTALLSSLRARPLHERDAPDVNAEFAANVLAAFAFCSREIPLGVASEVVLATADALGAKGAGAVPRVEAALQFWEHRAVLERRRALRSERIEFAHESLSDFTTAQWIVAMAPTVRRAWLARHGRTARTTAVFAVAIGGEEVLQELLDGTGDPADLPLHASAASELETLSSTILDRLAKTAAESLASTIPVVSERAARSLVRLVSRAPEQFTAAAVPALDGPGSWNELAAMCVLVTAGDSYVPSDRLLGLVRRTASGEVTRDMGQRDLEIESSLWHQLLVPALEHLVRTRRDLVAPVIGRFVEDHKNISAGDFAVLIGRLKRWGFVDLLEAHLARSAAETRPLRHHALEEWQADVAFLLLLVRVFGPIREGIQADPRCSTIGRLVGMLDFANAPAGNWSASLFLHGGAPVETIVRGVAFAGGLDPQVLAAEATSAFGTIVGDTPPRSLFYSGLFHIRVASPKPLEWERTADLDLQLDPLFDALHFGGQLFPHHALMLILHHKNVQQVRDRLAGELLVDKSFAIDAAAVAASEIFGASASDVLSTTLDASLNPSTARLLPALARLEPNSVRAVRLVRAALRSSDSAVVRLAAEAAGECGGRDTIEDIHAALTAWVARSQGAMSPDDRGEASFVGESLLGALAKKEALTYDLLVPLTKSAQLHRAASRQLASLVVRIPELLERVVREVGEEVVPERVLERLLDQSSDAALAPVAGKLIALAAHPNVAVRATVTRALGTATWLSRDEAHRALRARLQDPDASVRTDAQRALDGEPAPRGFSRMLRSRSIIG